MLALGAVLLSVPAAHADGSAQHRTVRLTAGAIAQLSKRFENRIDGTPAQVASVEAASTAATPQAAPAAGGETTAAPSLNLRQTGQLETARGFAETMTLGGTGDWVGVFSGGTVTRYDAQGNAVWDRGATSLYQDWKVTPNNWYQTDPYLPNLYEGYNPYEMSATGTHPYATGDFNHDGVADVAVAYAVGDNPFRPSASPGSQLTYGSFVTVLDGRSGRTLWSKLVPNYVGNLLVEDGKLIVADDTGPNWQYDPTAEQGDSRSNLTAYGFTPAKGGTLTGTAAWTYSTHAPNASWGDLESLGNGRLTASWSDTPMGLGSPRPAAGQVLVLDAADGRVAVDAKTPGYPRMLVKDPSGNRVLVVEQNDPFDAVRWDLTAIDARSGARTVITSREGTIPEAFQVVPDAHGQQARYAVAELGINADLTDGQSSVSGLDAHGKTLWQHTTASSVGGANAPTLALSSTSRGSGEVVASVSDPEADSAADPDGPQHTQVIGFNATSGAVDWKQQGALSGDQFTSYQGRLLTVGYDDTAYTFDPQQGRPKATPLLGDIFSAVAADVNGDGVKDLVVGGQSRGVFAVDGRTLKKPMPTILWRSTVSGSVHDLKAASFPDQHGRGGASVVAATGSGFAVLDTRTGAVRSDVDTRSGYVGSVTLSDDGRGGSEIVVPSDTLTAYRADGSKVWSYRPAGTSGKSLAFSDVATDGAGHLLLEYGGTKSDSDPAAKLSDPAPTVVSLNAATGAPLWSVAPSDPGALWMSPGASVYADPNVPGADGHGVAVAFRGQFPGAANEHLVQILDARTGAVVSSHEDSGYNSFESFTAAKAYGLVETLSFGHTVYPADGGAPYNLTDYLNAHSGAFATGADGSQAYVAAEEGLSAYALPFPTNGDTVLDAGRDFALGANAVTTAQLSDGPGTDLIGLAFDWFGYDIPLQAVDDGADFSPDYYPHGITVDKLSAAEARAGAKAQVSSRARVHSTADIPTAPTAPVSAPVLPDPGLPSGIVTPSIEVRSTTSVTTAGSDTTAAEVTSGYTPQQIRTRLGLKGDGSGQTVAIVDAYDYPTAEADLNHFAAHFDLPPTCDSVSRGTDCFDFQQHYADGTRPAGNSGWNEEAALDIEWAHAVAPHAAIVLVESADAGMAALERADDAAAALHPAAVSNSWGSGEFSEEGFYDSHCRLADSVCVQSTGDNGYPSGYSATNPYVLAIGGTSLHLDADGTTTGETAWSSTGGGLSFFEKRPAYQDGVQPSALRATPDVSMVADPRTGVPVYVSLLQGSTLRSLWLEVGGTSLSAPIWGAVLSSADQLRAAAGKPHLASSGPDGDTAHGDVYGLGSGYLSDITSGSNGACGAECTAGPGYDTVTGLGSPTAGVDAALAAMK
ncbi:hypothetical protein ACEZDB_16255 [Streptacidiphilus sp. N1-3]|uniref:Peptidase S53 domain-containing protein n=1 Tax=Streptacidiphilus alkalitolerans TaxID=3342712 RepID=A0ABV6X1N1_9ACTN